MERRLVSVRLCELLRSLRHDNEVPEVNDSGRDEFLKRPSPREPSAFLQRQLPWFVMILAIATTAHFMVRNVF
jgi:hypothetical protein